MKVPDTATLLSKINFSRKEQLAYMDSLGVFTYKRTDLETLEANVELLPSCVFKKFLQNRIKCRRGQLIANGDYWTFWEHFSKTKR